MGSKIALVLGASGLVGRHCLTLLLEDDRYQAIHVVVRKELPLSHSKLHQHVSTFSDLEQIVGSIHPNEIFCCLGSTIKQAGSKEMFRKVDYEYPLRAAEAGLRSGTEHFLLVSAMGANATSALFYNRVKGDIEAAISSLHFRSISIFQPSLLLGDRKESRPGETVGKIVMKVISPFLLGWFKQYRAIEALTVARAMLAVAARKAQDVHVFQSAEIEELGKK